MRRARPVAGPGRSRGFALIIVLWAVLALASGGAVLVANGRRALAEAGAEGAAARAAAALDGAAQETVFHLLAEGQARWEPTGTRTLRQGEHVVAVSIVNLAGAVNPNTASAQLLAALLVALGQPNAAAAALGRAIVEWRTEADPQVASVVAERYRGAGLPYAPPGARFQTIGELGLVLGMTPDLLTRLRPFLSLWQPGEPNPALAAPLVRAAIRAAAGADELAAAINGGPPAATGAIAVVLTCRIESGPGRAARRVVVQLQPAAPRPFHVVESTDIANP